MTIGPQPSQALSGALETTRHRDVLRRIVEDAAERGTGANVWIAGCGTGEHAYVMAIRLTELARDLGAPAARILGTDSDAAALQVALAGAYSADRLDGLDDAIRRRHFAFDSRTGLFEVRKALRAVVRFAPIDATARLPFRGPFDAILMADAALDPGRVEASLIPGGRIVATRSDA